MTDDKISQLVQDVVNGKEDPSKALNLIWPLNHENPKWIQECAEQIINVLQQNATISSDKARKVWRDLRSQTPKQKGLPSRWVYLGGGDSGTSLEKLSTDEQAYRGTHQL